MARSDVDVVRRVVDALNRGDVEGVLAELDPAVVWEEGGVVYPDLPSAYHGYDGYRRWYREAIVDVWESLSAELLELRDEGNGKVVGLYRVRGRGRESGVDVDMRVITTAIVRDGRIVHRYIEPA